jgi:protoheme IX farnesyltransferase
MSANSNEATVLGTGARQRSMVAVLADLTKARVNLLVLITAAIGFLAGSGSEVDYPLFFHTLFGTAVVAAAAAALNQYLERGPDSRMRRTERRALPSGRLSPDAVLVGAGLTAVAGMGYLVVAVNLTTAFLGAFTLCTYLFVYTPLKRVTTVNTSVGAIPGAVPPLMGWAGAQGEIALPGWSLFAILFFWQLPHFMAIAWIYREDYARGGFAMVPVFDPEGRRTSLLAVSHTLGLLPVSLAPFVFHIAGTAYLVGALVLGLGFLVFAVRFARDLSLRSAKQLFWASIVYLPALLVLLVVDGIR